MLKRFHRDERGVAMITAMLVGMAVLSLSLITVQLAAHNSGQSSLDRKRTQAVHAAEAGLDSYLAMLPRTAAASIQCTPAAVALPISPGAQFRVTAKFYPTYPGVVGQELTCPLASSPAGAVVTSVGTAIASGTATAVSRTMQTEIRLNPVYGGFGFAIFSDTGLNLQNNLTVTGNAGNDGDLYTNGPFICSNGTTDYGSVSTQGAATLSNSCNLIQDLRANGAISMSNTAHVGHDATSSTGSITMSNSARIDNNARAATTCSSCTGRVGGTITASSPSAAPAPIPLPVINYDSAAWQTAGYTIHSDNNCATADTWIEGLNGSSTKYVERISPTCTLDLSKNTITLGADLAIITDGSILTAQKTTIQSSSSTVRSLHLIIPKSSVGSCTGTQNISFANQTDFINVRVFIYTPCTVALSNNNVGDGGQIIGGTVLIQNHITFAYRPFLVPGAGSVTGYNPDVAYLREIKNGS